MRMIIVTAIILPDGAIFNIGSIRDEIKNFGSFAIIGGFIKETNFTNNDDSEAAQKKIDYIIKTCEKYIEYKKKNFDKIDDLVMLFTQAVVTNKLKCFQCNNEMIPIDTKCSHCGWKNVLISEGFI